MKQLLIATRNFLCEEEGVTALEYGLFAALIAAVIIGTVTTIGTTLETVFKNICNSLKAGACP